jgi:pyruvate dehydrogenase E2 component (dihydrolipoamide acetyltransferase)
MSARRGASGIARRLVRALEPPAEAAAVAAAAAATTRPFAAAARPSPPPAARLLWPAAARPFAAAAAGGLPPHEELTMPALSPTMSTGSILAWKKRVGDAIAEGDVYCEVETDKATMEWEAQEAGFLAAILVPEGARDVPVGTPVAVVCEEEGDLGAFENHVAGGGSSGGAAAAAPAAAAPAAAALAGAARPPHAVLGMPALSPTMSSGAVLAWKVAPGSPVAAGDIIAEVETDKATMEWEAQDDGVVAALLVEAGASLVEVGAPVIVIVDDAADVEAFKGFTAADAAGGGAPAAAAPAPAAPAPAAPKQQQAVPAAPARAAPARAAAPAPAPGARVVASPYARRLAAEAGASLAGVAGSGPRGRIVAADVAALLASGGAVSASAATGESAWTDEAASNIRRVTARRLLESKTTVPHYYLTVGVRVDALLAARARLNARLAKAEPAGKLSVNDFVIKAAALASRAVPDANASWHGDFIRRYHSVDCSVAVQTPAGLMVPVLRDADKKGLAAISAEVRALAARAKEGRLKPEEMAGGSLTVSNLGMFGVTQFSAIVNPPQAVILAVGAAEARVVPAAGGGEGKFETAQYLNATLSADHRVIDGAAGAAWLAAFRGFLEDPASMLL